MLLAINWLLVRRLGLSKGPFAETRSQRCRDLLGAGGARLQRALGMACMGVFGVLATLYCIPRTATLLRQSSALALHSRSSDRLPSLSVNCTFSGRCDPVC